MEKVIRKLILLIMVSYVAIFAWSYVFFGYLADDFLIETDAALTAMSPLGDLDSVNSIAVLVALVVWTLAHLFGLLFTYLFRDIGRKALLISTIASPFILLFIGYVIDDPISMALDEIGILATGAVVALSYYSNAKESFR